MLGYHLYKLLGAKTRASHFPLLPVWSYLLSYCRLSPLPVLHALYSHVSTNTNQWHIYHTYCTSPGVTLSQWHLQSCVLTPTHSLQLPLIPAHPSLPPPPSPSSSRRLRSEALAYQCIHHCCVQGSVYTTVVHSAVYTPLLCTVQCIHHCCVQGSVYTSKHYGSRFCPQPLYCASVPYTQ